MPISSRTRIRLRNLKSRLRSAFHAALTSQRFSSIGKGCKIFGDGITLGNRVVIGDFCWIESIHYYKTAVGVQSFSPRLVVEDDVALSDFVHISCVDHVRVGAGTLIGSKVYIGDHSHGSTSSDEVENHAAWGPRQRPLADISAIHIGKNCWIGDGAVILAGTQLGDNCIIAANSVVKGEFPANLIVGGIPARKLKDFSR